MDKRHLQTRTSIALAMTLTALSFWTAADAWAKRSHAEPAADAGTPSIAVPADRLPTQTEAVQRPCPRGAKLCLPPILEPGKSAWGSVSDQAGLPLAGVSVLIEGSAVATGPGGNAVFTVPRSGALSINMVDADGGKSGARSYELSPSGLLSLPQATEKAADKLLSPLLQAKLPVVAYAPLVVAPGQTFVIVGRNFSGKPGEDRVSLDGYELPVLSGSTTALVVQAPGRLPPALLRSLTVTSGGIAANKVECDTVNVRLDFERKSGSGKGKENQSSQGQSLSGSLALVGTDLPCAIQLVNQGTEEWRVTTGDTTTTAPSRTMITPGGDNNRLPLTITTTSGATPSAAAELLGDAPELTVAESLILYRADQIFFDLRRAEVVKIKRRLTALEARLAESRAKLEALSAGDEGAAKIEADLKALSLRQQALETMLSARRALMEASGVSEKTYLETLDEATGGAYYLSEKPVKGIAYTAGAGLATETVKNNTVDVQPKGSAWRYRNLPVPKIILLPPQDWETRFGFAPAAASDKPKPAGLEPQRLPMPNRQGKFNEYGQPLPTDNPQEPRIEALKKSAAKQKKPTKEKPALKKKQTVKESRKRSRTRRRRRH